MFDEIVGCFVKEEGSFYLYGLTWPVPDAIEKEALERDLERYVQVLVASYGYPGKTPYGSYLDAI